MREEYDFSGAERGRFYRPNATLRIPIYLDPDVDEVVRSLAERTGQDVENLVNDWMRKNIDIIQSVEPVPRR
ncbi:MAG: hypothetical protein HC802_14855 [Caldilineaceae bacterium]|nr:hypothetical protein [Caldilineaceae bacterium]